VEKQMYFEPEKGNSVHAVDSVELVANKHIVPLQTTALANTNQIQQNMQHSHQGSGKGHVQSDEQLEFMPKSNKYESKVDEDLNKEYVRPIRAPRMIEFEQAGQQEEETWSTISGSVAKNWWNVNTARMHLLQQEAKASSSQNYYGLLQDVSKSEEDQNGEEESEMMEMTESSFDPNISEVNSGKYMESRSKGEDDEAFFEILADMTAMLDAEPESVSQKESDAHDGEASNESGGLRRSTRTMKVNQRNWCKCGWKGISLEELLVKV
jgi:hypothetical protein